MQVGSLEEAIAIINDRPKPLALYAFSKNQDTIQKILAETSSGAFVTNEVVTHVSGTEFYRQRVFVIYMDLLLFIACFVSTVACFLDSHACQVEVAIRAVLVVRLLQRNGE